MRNHARDCTPIVTTPPEDIDTDGDGDEVIDQEDNCVDIANLSQENHDQDLLGDACDPDDDNDGIMDMG